MPSVNRMLRVLGFVLVAACAKKNIIVVNGHEVYERVWERTVSDITSRATFDLGCPAEQLTVTLLEKYGRDPVEVGVEGCGHRIRYTRPRVPGGFPGSWVANTTTR